MFVNVTGDAFPAGDLSKLPDGRLARSGKARMREQLSK
jgi:hypothetical protein